MNNVTLIGRLTKDPETRYTQAQEPVVRFTLAVDRAGRDAGADFISCTAFGKTAEVIGKYCTKGRQIGIQGCIRTGSYERQDGTKTYYTEVTVYRMDLIGSREDAPAPQAAPAPSYQTARAAAPAPAPTYQTMQAPQGRYYAAEPVHAEQIPVNWMAEPIQPDEDLPF